VVVLTQAAADLALVVEDAEAEPPRRARRRDQGRQPAQPLPPPQVASDVEEVATAAAGSPCARAERRCAGGMARRWIRRSWPARRSIPRV